jgi:hypothetical protein
MDINILLNKLTEEINEDSPEDIEVENPGLLEVPKNKDVDDLPLKHFKDLIEKKGYEEVIRGLQNLRRWNKNRDPKLSDWADNTMDKLKDWVEKKREDNPDFAK